MRQKNFELDVINLPDKLTYDEEYDKELFKRFYRIRSFMFKFILRLLAEILTFNFNGESCTIIRQVITINSKKRI